MFSNGFGRWRIWGDAGFFNAKYQLIRTYRPFVLLSSSPIISFPRPQHSSQHFYSSLQIIFAVFICPTTQPFIIRLFSQNQQRFLSLRSRTTQNQWKGVEYKICYSAFIQSNFRMVLQKLKVINSLLDFDRISLKAFASTKTDATIFSLLKNVQFQCQIHSKTEKLYVQYNNQKNSLTKPQMERRIVIKTKSSGVGEEVQGKFYKIRARMGKKQIKHMQMEGASRAGKLPRVNSCSPRKMRSALNNIFKEARKVRSCETYLISETQLNPKNQEDLASPRPKPTRHPKHFFSNSHLPNNRNFSPRQFRNSPSSSGKNDIQTIEIRIAREKLQPKNKEELMTTLSRIIFGEAGCSEGLTFEVSESSILGSEENYIEIDEMFLPESMRVPREDYIRI